MTFSIKMDVGIITKAMQKMAEQAPEITRKQMAKAGRRIASKAREQVPVDFGILKSSIKSKTSPKSQGNPETSISADTEYAVYVHEDMTARHPTGKAKYIEDPFKEEMPQFQSDLADALISDLKEGSK